MVDAPKIKKPRAFRRGDAVFHPQFNSDPRPLSTGVITNRTAAGRSSGFRINLRPRLPILIRIVTSSGLCPRLQRRDRDGLAPSSLSPGEATRRDMVNSYYSPLQLSRGISSSFLSITPGLTGRWPAAQVKGTVQAFVRMSVSLEALFRPFWLLRDRVPWPAQIPARSLVQTCWH